MVNVRMHQGSVMSVYEGAKTRVIVIIELSEELVVNVRMHQGSVMSLTLLPAFDIALESSF